MNTSSTDPYQCIYCISIVFYDMPIFIFLARRHHISSLCAMRDQWGNPGQGVWYLWGQFGVRASLYIPPTSISAETVCLKSDLYSELKFKAR